MSLRRFVRSRFRYTFSLDPVFLCPAQIDTPVKNDRSVFLFADEILQKGLTLRDTSLYGAARAGANIKRRIGPNGTLVRLVSDDDFDRYHSRFLALTESILKHGIVEISKAPDVAISPKERNIKVLARTDRTLRHKSCGKHRLAIAKALKLPSIPVHIFFNSPAAWCVFHADRVLSKLHTSRATASIAISLAPIIAAPL